MLMASESPQALWKLGVYCPHADYVVSFGAHRPWCICSPYDSRLAVQEPGRIHGPRNSTLAVSPTPMVKVPNKQAFQNPNMGLYRPVLWRMDASILWLKCIFFFILHV